MKGIIIYSTKYGSTEKAVKMLLSKLPAGFAAADLSKGKVPELSQYDTVILGGPIYAGKTLKEVSNFMEQNIEVLKKKRLGLFLCAGEENLEKRKEMLAAVFPGELHDRAAAKEVLGGELYWDKLDFMTKLILRLFIGVKEGYKRLSEANINSFAKAVSGQ